MKKIVLTITIVLCIASLAFADTTKNAKKLSELSTKIDNVQADKNLSEEQRSKAFNEIGEEYFKISDSVLDDFVKAYEGAMKAGVEMSGNEPPKEIQAEMANMNSMIEELSIISDSGTFNEQNQKKLEDLGMKIFKVLTPLINM